jgi:hypothetical protein
VVIAGVGIHRKQLVADAKGRLAPGFDLVGLRQGQAKLSQAGQGLGRQRRFQCGCEVRGCPGAIYTT